VPSTCSEAARGRLLRFNPWLFSGTEELVTRFLSELGLQLKGAGKARSDKALEKVGEAFETYGEVLTPLGWVPVAGPWLARAGQLLKTTSKAFGRSPVSADAQRQLIVSKLDGIGHRVLVIIDDLDRVEADQVRDVIRLIKLVADFPNTTYLIAYDRQAIENALSRSTYNARAYLEKIVQVEHDLPPVAESALMELFFEDLQGVLNRLEDPGPFHEATWPDVYQGVLRPLLASIRHIRRYINTVPVTLRVVGSEVALVDVLALEAIRIFVPDVYALIPASIPALTGKTERHWREPAIPKQVRSGTGREPPQGRWGAQGRRGAHV
jgi:predicted KAP-like P-loop ATPase